MKKETAIFAGGCFWCMVEPFEEQPGILNVVSGYTGGHVANPTYEQVSSHTTGHTEAVEITFDADVIDYPSLLNIYWQQTDPTDAMGQFQDRGDNYRPVIFVKDEAQRQAAEASKAALEASGRFSDPIVTKIESAKPFYPAEPEHRTFYEYLMTLRNPNDHSEVAEFAKNAFLDQSFPKHEKDYHRLSDYLELNGNYLPTMAIFDETYRDYEASESTGGDSYQ